MKSIISVIILLIVCIFLQSRVAPAKTQEKFLLPPEGLRHFLFGYNDAAASLLWIRVVQNLDYCETGRYTEADYVPAVPSEGRTILDAVITRKLKPSKCHKGWVYNMLNVISLIEPQFRLVYDHGANFLSIIVDDREGARLIFEKGLKLYPTDWQMNVYAAYLYLWELQDAKRAVELMSVAVRYGAPPIIANIAANIYDEGGQSHLAEVILREAINNDPPEAYKKILEEKLKKIQDAKSAQ